MRNRRTRMNPTGSELTLGVMARHPNEPRKRDGGQTWTSLAGPTGISPPVAKETIEAAQTASCGSALTCVMVGFDSSGPAASFTTDGATTWTQGMIG